MLFACFLFLPLTPFEAQTHRKDDADLIAGKAYYQKQDYKNARFHLLRYVRDYPEDQQALLMLVHIEEDAKNYASAIVHVNELLALNPYNSGLWLKKISMYRAQHNDVEADRLLERLCDIYPENDSLQLRWKARQQEIIEINYQTQRENGDVEGQISTLRRFIADANRSGSSRSEVSYYYMSLCNLLEQQGRTSEAMDVAMMALNAQPGNMAFIKKKVGILSAQGRTMEAYSFAKAQAHKGNNAELQRMLKDLEDQLLLEAKLSDPYIMSGRKWENSHDKEALQFLISTAINHGYLDDAQFYLGEARKLYGETPELLYKSYLVEKRLGNTGNAMKFLHKVHAVHPEDQEVTDELAKEALRNATDYILDERYSDALVLLDSIIVMAPDSEIVVSALHKQSICNRYFDEKALKEKLTQWDDTVRYMHDHHLSAELIEVADSALAVDSTLEMVRYYKGLAHERLHQWNEAYNELRRYEPSSVELPEYRRHLASLLHHTYKNTVNVDYQQARLGAVDRITANASVEYTRKLDGDDEVSGMLAYTARDFTAAEANEYYDEHDNLVIKPTTESAVDKGGVGIQASANYHHRVNEKLSYEVGGGLANRYFPIVTLKGAVSWELQNDYTASARASYRLTDSYRFGQNEVLRSGYHTSIFNVGGTGTKTIDDFFFSANADLFLVRNHLYFNASGKAQYFPLEHSRTHVFATLGAGTAPEIEIIDNSLPSGYKHVNTFVGAGGFVALTNHLGAGVNGSWYNLVNHDANHKNYFYINASLQIVF